MNDTLEHGKASTYTNYGCRCRPCTDANTANTREWRRTKRILTLSLDIATTRTVRDYAHKHDISYAETIRRAVRLLTS